jgi:hypothetical protein
MSVAPVRDLACDLGGYDKARAEPEGRELGCGADPTRCSRGGVLSRDSAAREP